MRTAVTQLRLKQSIVLTLKFKFKRERISCRRGLGQGPALCETPATGVEATRCGVVTYLNQDQLLRPRVSIPTNFMEGEPLEGGLSQLLWQDGRIEAYASLHHPFVQALAQDRLPK